jgi:hypothetical protein
VPLPIGWDDVPGGHVERAAHDLCGPATIARGSTSCKRNDSGRTRRRSATDRR